MSKLTLKETAERLNITPAAVLAFVKSGALESEVQYHFRGFEPFIAFDPRDVNVIREAMRESWRDEDFRTVATTEIGNRMQAIRKELAEAARINASDTRKRQ